MKRFKDIFTLRAFKPNILDPEFPLRDRLQGNPIALINIGSFGLKIARGLFSKSLTITDTKYFLKKIAEPPIFSKEVLNHLEHCSSEGLVALSLGEKISMPLGSTLDKGFKSQSVSLNGSNIIGAVKEPDLVKIQNAFSSHGFTILRIQLTPVNLLYALSEEASNTVRIILDQGTITVFSDKGLRSRLVDIEQLEASNSEESEILQEFFEDILGHEKELELAVLETGIPTKMWEIVKAACPYLTQYPEKMISLNENLEFEILCHD